MLKHRLLMSALLIPATIGLFYWDDQFGLKAPILFVIVLVISARCVWELVVLSRVAGFLPNLSLCWIWTATLLFAGWAPNLYPMSAAALIFKNGHAPFGWLAAMAMSILLMAMIRFRSPDPTSDCAAMQTLDSMNRAAGNPTNQSCEPRAGFHLGSAGIEFLIINYVGVLMVVTAQLRWVDQGGYFALSALVIATKMGDVGAYTFGRLIGGPKMVPRLSPGKTWAGGVGHLVTAGLCSAAWLCWIGPKVSSFWFAWGFWPAIVFGVVVGFAGLIGDLVESLIKRDVGVKDAPALLPGFGGLLDLMDSILLAGPVAYAMWLQLR